MLGQLSHCANVAQMPESEALTTIDCPSNPVHHHPRATGAVTNSNIPQPGVSHQAPTIPDVALPLTAVKAVGHAVSEPTERSPEIVAAAGMLAELLLPEGTAYRVETELKNRIAIALAQRFRGHWFHDQPERGSGYRSLSFRPGPGGIDATLRSALVEIGMVPSATANSATANVATETTVWVDPGTVASRTGGGPLRLIYGCANIPLDSPSRGRSGSPGLGYQLSPKASEFTPRSRSQSPPKTCARKALSITIPDQHAVKTSLKTATSTGMAMSPPPGLITPPPGLRIQATPPGLKIPAFLFNSIRA